MKIVMMVSALFFSFAASAEVTDLTWKEIENGSKHYVDASGTYFNQTNPRALGTPFRRFVSVDGKMQVCLKGNVVYGGVVPGCVKVSDKSKFPQCKKYEPTEIWAPAKGTSRICVEWLDDDSTTVCAKYTEVAFDFTKPQTAKIYIKALRDEDRVASNRGFVGTKSYKLPACSGGVVGH